MTIEDLETSTAFSFASTWHRGQKRKGIHREDFVQHPLRVAQRLIRHELSDTDLIQAALLHDVLEDTDCPQVLISDTFGEEVLSLVLEVTDDKTLLKSERKQRQVERAETLSPKASMIRLSDKIDNVGTLCTDPPATWGWPRHRAYIAWATRVVNRIPHPHPGMLTEFQSVREEAWSLATGQQG
jgi:guanosine-3',5'-bis(diphosphate) 3'-pyrophosphohydrolase